MDIGLVDAFSLAGLAFLLKKFIDVLRQLRGGDVGAALTQVLIWIVGIGLFWLAASSKVFANVEVGGFAFSDLDWAARVLGGLALASTASVVQDSNVARDNSQSGELPRLLPLKPLKPLNFGKKKAKNS